MAPNQVDDPWAITGDLAGRRSELARWIADAGNPLTTRSIVNRVWQYHFGRGLAANPNNFGVSGAKPTHPELLDWLARDFVQGGWKLKRLHRLIMTSEAYRQSTERPDMVEVREKDPNNALLAYFEPRRLTAEEMRDVMLSVSGELNPELGGVPIMPEINMEVALQPRMIQFSIAPAHQPSRTPAERNRRSIYTYRVRGLANPFPRDLQPSPIPTTRARTARLAHQSRPQALHPPEFSDVVTARSLAFCTPCREGGRPPCPRAASIAGRTQLAFGRPPTPARRSESLVALRAPRCEEYHRKHVTPSPPGATRRSITRSLVEEFTGQPFEYEEILQSSSRNYVPDRQKPGRCGLPDTQGARRSLPPPVQQQRIRLSLLTSPDPGQKPQGTTHHEQLHQRTTARIGGLPETRVSLRARSLAGIGRHDEPVRTGDSCRRCMLPLAPKKSMFPARARNVHHASSWKVALATWTPSTRNRSSTSST